MVSVPRSTCPLDKGIWTHLLRSEPVDIYHVELGRRQILVVAGQIDSPTAAVFLHVNMRRLNPDPEAPWLLFEEETLGQTSLVEYIFPSKGIYVLDSMDQALEEMIIFELARREDLALAIGLRTISTIGMILDSGGTSEFPSPAEAIQGQLRHLNRSVLGAGTHSIQWTFEYLRKPAFPDSLEDFLRQSLLTTRGKFEESFERANMVIRSSIEKANENIRWSVRRAFKGTRFPAVFFISRAQLGSLSIAPWLTPSIDEAIRHRLIQEIWLTLALVLQTTWDGNDQGYRD